MKKIILTALIGLLLPFAGFAQHVEFEEYDLDNGLHVILSQNHKTPNVVVSVMYHVGSKNEVDTLTGFAHFFEHLMFEGTENIPRHTYDKYVSDAGGELNANTSFDRTYYFELLPSNYLELGLWLESERMMHPKIEEIGVNTQKDVVCQEMGQTRDNVPYGTALTTLLKDSFKKHPYRHDVLGSEEHVRNASIQDFRNFHDMFYVPNNAVLTICGDFQKEEAKAMVAKYFTDIPAGTMKIRRPDPNIEPARTEPVKDTVYDNIQLPLLICAYPAPAYGTDDYYALNIFSNILSDGESSRLTSKIVNEEEMAVMAMTAMIPFEHPAGLLIQALPNQGVEVAELESEIDKEIFNLIENGISDEEFQKVMNRVELQTIASNSGIERIAEELATSYTYFKNTNAVNEVLKRSTDFTKEQVIETARKYIRPEAKVSVYYLPKSEN